MDKVLFVMLNPSTADASANDPTIERCQRRAKSWGYGGIMVGNLFGLRATDPKIMLKTKDPFGPGNLDAVRAMAGEAALVVCGWGVHGSHRSASSTVLRVIRGVGKIPHHLGLTKSGEPRHPLVPYSTTPQPIPVSL